MSELFDKAEVIARRVHADQVRKDFRSGEKNPYIVHPLAVVASLKVWGVEDERILAAGVLHDAVEDCKPEAREALIAEIRDLDVLVLEYVLRMSNPEGMDDLPNALRVRAYADHIHNDIAPHPVALLLKCADFLDNAPGVPSNFYRLIKKYKAGSKELIFAVRDGKLGDIVSMEVQARILAELEAIRF